VSPAEEEHRTEETGIGTETEVTEAEAIEETEATAEAVTTEVV
jgi:hypothetical protein